MGKAGKIARRSFLIGSASIVGGVAFGAYLAKRPVANPLLEDLAQGEAAITPYVKIDAQGITLITPRADKGQGAYALQANLIAEELDIDPAKATLTPGQPGPAYYNAAVLEEGVPFPAYDDSWIAQRVRGMMVLPARLMEMQLTGGSSTAKDSYVKLRMAGAIARETLKQAAAELHGLARHTLTTEDGHVILPDGTRIPYTDLAAKAATIDPVRDVTLRDASQWRILGKPGQRLDIMAKSTGTEHYGIDLRLPGMLHATVRANPGLGGDVASFDASQAETMRGVQKILPIQHGIGVLADNTWRAIQAANAIDIEWGPAPYPINSEAIWDELNATLDNPDRRDHRQRNDGDVEQALSNGTPIAADYRLPYLAHAPLEPMNAIVRVTDTACDIWTGTQIPIFVRNHAADLTGLDRDQVHVHVQPMGGSFGHRLEDTHVVQAVELAMAVKGTPVKLTWSREEDMTHDYPRPAAVARARGTVSDGKVETFDLSVASSSVVESWFGRLMGPVPGPDASITAGAWDQPFDIPNYRVTGYRAPEMVPVSSWRSVGASGNGFLHDCFLDELIHAAGADPLAERIRLCMHEPSRKVLEAVGEMCGWDGPSPAPGVGRGVAFCLSFGTPCAQVVEVAQTEDGLRLQKLWVAADIGLVLDPVNTQAQIFGGALFGLAHAMNCELTYEDFAAQQENFWDYEGLRINQVPEVEVRVLTNMPGVRGIGEPGVPPSAPALANAIFAATGKRIREMPLNRHVDFA